VPWSSTAIGWAIVGVRAIALAAVGLAAIVAGTHYAVRRKWIKPFSGWSVLVRRLSDPALRPIERRLLSSGHNPQTATTWLLGIAVLAGLLLITLVQSVLAAILTLATVGPAGPRAWIHLAIDWGIGLLMALIFVRVISSWIGISPYTKLMRPVFRATEWIIAPIRRVAPAVGPFDISPMLAYLALLIVRSLLLTAV